MNVQLDYQVLSRGTVVLTGTLPPMSSESAAQLRQRIGEMFAQVRGVRSVANELQPAD